MRPPTRVVVIAMNKLREVMLETPEVLDNARLTADGRNLYLIKTRVRTSGKKQQGPLPERALSISLGYRSGGQRRNRSHNRGGMPAQKGRIPYGVSNQVPPGTNRHP